MGDIGQVKIRSTRADERHTIVLAGELDVAGAPAVEAEVMRAKASDATSLVIDLSDLEFIDSTGLRVLIAANSRSEGEPRLEIIQPTGYPMRVLEIAGVLDVLPLRQSVAELDQS